MSTHALDYLPRVSNTGRAYHGRMLVSFSYCGSVAVMHYKRKLVCTVLVYQRFDGSGYELDIMYAPAKSPHQRQLYVLTTLGSMLFMMPSGGCAVTDVLEGKSMYIEFVYLDI